MKKLLALALALLFVLTAVSCGQTPPAETDDTGTTASDVATPANDLKIGVILVGDENEGYTYAHIEGIKKAAAALDIKDDQIIWKYRVKEDETCYDAAAELADSGCNLVISNSYGHQSYMLQAAKEIKDVTFVALTGDTAKASGLDNFCNAFTGVYESRYVSGVVAGMKLAELIAADKLTDANYTADKKVKIGYVGAYPYAEVVSGYTAFYLGLKSIVPDVAMQVTYTNSWFDITAEGEAANSLLADGCVIIAQHADSTGAPAAVEAALAKGTVAYSVGYNVDMLSVAPNAALTSASNNWSVYYEYAFSQMLKGEKVATNWSEGYNKDAVAITALGASCAAGTAEKVEATIAAIKDGSLHVFDTKTFTVGGAEVTNAFASDTNGDFVNDADEAIIDGYYHESFFQSAPSFSLRIDGITELN